jgi:DNA-binding response OmpR family regulator
MEGFEPTVINDSTQAIDAAHTINPDIITLDLMMPKLSGYDLCRLLHEDPIIVDTPIIIVSAKADPASIKMAMDAGAKEFITKPFHLDSFVEMIKSLVTSIT